MNSDSLKFVAYLVAVALFFCSFVGKSQNSIIIGAKSYPSTESWAFTKSGNYFGYEPDARLYITVARSGSGGYLKLSTSATSMESISNTVLLYLRNGKVISISDRKVKEYVDEETVAVFALTSDQVSSLKEADILKIRYDLISNLGKKGFTADNRNLVGVNPNTYKVHETAKAIIELFSN